MRLWTIGGASIHSCAKHVANYIGWSRGMLPREILILVDTIWWNLGLRLHKHNLPFTVSLKHFQDENVRSGQMYTCMYSHKRVASFPGFSAPEREQ